MNAENLTVGLAFIAGLISFVSPCVLPLVPAYIGYMGGRVTNTVAAQVAAGGGQVALRQTASTRFNTVIHGLFFIGGFTFVFVTLGIVTTVLVQQVGGQNISLITDIIGRLGGLVIIFFGLHFMGVMPKIFARLLKSPRLNSLMTTILVAIIGTLILLWGFVTAIETGPDAQFSLNVRASSLTIAGGSTIGGTFVAWFIPIPALVAVVAFLLWLVLGGAFATPGPFWRGVLGTLQGALYADTRRQMTASKQQGYLGSSVMGIVFSAGWTPCIGPVYGAVLTLAANTGDAGRAIPLLAAYSLGLGVPFLATAFLLDGAQGILRKLQRHMHKVELVSGAFLVFIGVLVATGSLAELTQRFATGAAADFSVQLEENVLNSLTGGSLNAEATPEATSESSDSSALPSLGSIEGAAAAAADRVGVEVGNLAPNFQTVTDDGQTISLEDLRGQAVLLNFWATWCGPCRVEMPEFEAAYTAHSGEGFTILAINNSETLEDVQGFREELSLTFPLLMDEDGTIQEQYGIVGYPSTFLVGRDGKIISRYFGALTSDQITDLVTAALAS